MNNEKNLKKNELNDEEIEAVSGGRWRTESDAKHVRDYLHELAAGDMETFSKAMRIASEMGDSQDKSYCFGDLLIALDIHH